MEYKTRVKRLKIEGVEKDARLRRSNKSGDERVEVEEEEEEWWMMVGSL